jgi:hypothetical protein
MAKPISDDKTGDVPPIHQMDGPPEIVSHPPVEVTEFHHRLARAIEGEANVKLWERLESWEGN